MTVITAKNRMRAVILLTCGVLFWGCGGGYSGKAADLDGKNGPTIETLRGYYQNEKFLETILRSKEFMRLNPGSRFLDEAQFLLARAEYEEGNYIEAEDRFRRLMRDFPNSDYAEDAAYYLPLSILSQSRKAELDQRETIAAKTQFKSFLIRYPDTEYEPRVRGHLERIDERLAKKDFTNGETYRKMKRFRSAAFYYEKVTDEWSESPYAEKSLYWLAEVAKSRKRWDSALAYTTQYLATYPQGSFSRKISELREQSLEKIASASTSAPKLSGEGGP